MQSEFLGGDGTYTKDRHIFASLTGLRTTVDPKTGASGGVSSLAHAAWHHRLASFKTCQGMTSDDYAVQKPVISVLKRGAVPLVPRKQDIVTAKVWILVLLSV